ncbi:MAG: hypothetical protein KAR01_00175, partial [Desulfocapsa sp.]|nr:hypothetical protein [Desulfocapsa sp.]
SSEGELIPFSRNGKSGFVKDEDGNFITSRLDETTLTKIAELTGGFYVPLGNSGEGLQTIYQQKLSLIPKEDIAEKRHKVALERFVWPLGAAIVLLMVEFMLGGRKSTRSLRIPFIKTAGRRKKKVASLLLLFTLIPFVVSQQAEASLGEEAYGNGDYISASTFYDEQLKESPNDGRLHYNYGTAAYKNNMFEDAVRAFTEALKSDDLALQEEAYYNRGNALFQRGNETLQTDPEHTIKMWEEAVASFDGSLQLDSMNDDARYNLEIVKKQLEELKKQQEEQEKKDQEKESDDKKDDQDKKKVDDQNEESKGDESSEKDSDQEESQKEDKGQQNNSESEEKGEDKEQQQDQTDSSAGEEQDEQDEQSAAGNDEQEAAEEAKEQQAARDQERRMQGKMTEEEAAQLLNSLKDESGELNFVPASISDGAKNQKISRDW